MAVQGVQFYKPFLVAIFWANYLNDLSPIFMKIGQNIENSNQEFTFFSRIGLLSFGGQKAEIVIKKVQILSNMTIY